MAYERKKKDVQAIRLIKSVFDHRGNMIADEGDWLVIEGNEQFYMTDEEFKEEFQKKEEADVPSLPLIIGKEYIPYPVPIYIEHPVPIYIEPCRPRRYWWQNPCTSEPSPYWISLTTSEDFIPHYTNDDCTPRGRWSSLTTESTTNCVYEARG